MSETANLIFKVISQLTAPRLAVKYLVVFVVLIGVTNIGFVDLFKIPTEYTFFAILLFCTGLGSLLGDGICLISNLVWKKIEEKIANKRDLKLVKLHESAQEKSIKAAREKLKKDFYVMIKVLSIREKNVLKDVYLDSLGHNSGQTYTASNNLAYVNTSLDSPLFNLGFLSIIERFNSTSALIRITPEINETVGDWLREGIEKEVDDFISRLKSTDISIIRLLDADLGVEEKSNIAIKVRPYILNFLHEYSTPCITASATGSRGIILRVSPLYKAYLENKLNVKLQEHAFVKTSYS